MKDICKKLFGLMTLALLVVGCSGSGDEAGEDVQPSEIKFTSEMETKEEITRADEKTLNDIGVPQFNVYGFKTPASGGVQTVFNNEAVWAPLWIYENKRYWDLSAQNYMFFGYNAGVGDNTSKGTYIYMSSNENSVTYQCGSIPFIEERRDGTLWTKNPITTTDPTPDYMQIQRKDIPYISHVWKGSPTPGENVKLTFFPPYSQVSIAFSRVASVDAEATAIKDIHFGPVSSPYGIFDHPDLNYTYTFNGTNAGRESYTITRREDHTLIFASGLPFDAMYKTKTTAEGEEEVGVLYEPDKPYETYPIYWTFPDPNGEHGEFEMSANIGGEKQTCRVPAEYTKWEMGIHYIYLFRLTREGVDRVDVIKVGIKNWEEIGSAETKWYNW
ncbi:MAG: fimbrillin family protein [Bacteroidaceae bacterium]|nr:fimbrillin family protein [Bacteroidaceae bacterium]